MTTERELDELARDIRGATARRPDALAAEYEERGRAPYRAAARVLADGAAAARARKVLELGGERGLAALTSRPLVDPRHDIALAAHGAGSLVQRVAGWLEGLLADKAPVPIDPEPWKGMEVKPPPRRVCDVAYLALRQLLHFGQDDLERANDANVFLNLSDGSKDAVIAKALASKDYSRFDLPPLPKGSDTI